MKLYPTCRQNIQYFGIYEQSEKCLVSHTIYHNRLTDERASKLRSTGGLRQAWLSTTKKGHKLYESYRVRLAMREQRESMAASFTL